MNNQAKYLFLAGFAGALLGGAVLKYSATPATAPAGLPTVHAAAAAEALANGSFAPVVKRATPAVVNISSSRTERVQANPMMMDPFFQRFFGDRGPRQPQTQKKESLGSGVVVTADGYILTNNHVVEGATEIKVAFTNRREYAAKLVGSDPQTDVAVLKIDQANLPVLPISDSSKVQIGDIVLAIGNPFGIGQTVTLGIISATGRNHLRIEGNGGYEDFIQTDAAINPGNSGGALVNSRGELVAINTAILGGGPGGDARGGNIGIGFAIPANMAKDVMDQIIKTGKVTRSYMGAYLQDIDADLAKAFRLKEAQGVAITRVEPDAPAGKAGLKAGDVVLAMNGQPVVDVPSFRLGVARMAPGSTINLKIDRNGQQRDVQVKLAEMPKEFASADQFDEDGAPGPRGNRRPGSGARSALTGVSVDDLTPQIARQLRLPADTQGVVITDVDPDSSAAGAGLRRGDVILEVNRTPVANMGEFDRVMRNAGSGTVLLLVNRGGATTFVPVEPAK